jgi:hypothetical protein
MRTSHEAEPLSPTTTNKPPPSLCRPRTFRSFASEVADSCGVATRFPSPHPYPHYHEDEEKQQGTIGTKEVAIYLGVIPNLDQ